MFKLRQLFGVVLVLLFLIIDKVASFLKVTRDGLVQHSSTFLCFRKLTVNDHALQRSRVTGLSGALTSLRRLEVQSNHLLTLDSSLGSSTYHLLTCCLSPLDSSHGSSIYHLTCYRLITPERE